MRKLDVSNIMNAINEALIWFAANFSKLAMLFFILFVIWGAL